MAIQQQLLQLLQAHLRRHFLGNLRPDHHSQIQKRLKITMFKCNVTEITVRQAAQQTEIVFTWLISVELWSPRLQLLASHPASQLAKCAQHCAQINDDLRRSSPLLCAGFHSFHPLLSLGALSAPFALIPTNLYFPLCGMCRGFFSRRISGWLDAHSARRKTSNNKLPNEESRAVNLHKWAPQKWEWVLCQKVGETLRASWC